MSKKYEVNGLKKRKHRGDASPMICKQTIPADSPEKARELFEKENPKYDANVVQEVSQPLSHKTYLPDAEDEKDKKSYGKSPK